MPEFVLNKLISNMAPPNAVTSPPITCMVCIFYVLYMIGEHPSGSDLEGCQGPIQSMDMTDAITFSGIAINITKVRITSALDVP